jgi:hypothetical protein
MDIFVLGKRAAQWLSEQLLGPRRTRAEPVAPRLWRGPGNIDCDQEACQWRCSSDGVGGYAWVLELSCPTRCSCPQPAIVCDSDNENSAYLTQCAATSTTTTTTGCSLYVCARRCQDDGTGNYAWVVEVDCPTSCDCPIPGVSCDASNFGDAVSLSCQTASSTTTSVNCSSYVCTRRCQDDGTGNYAWVVEIDCPTSCDCPTPGVSCDASNFGEEFTLTCVGSQTQGCVWFCEGGSYRLSQIGCPSADCCCNPPSVPCDSQTARQYVVLGCNCPTSTTQPGCENYCTWNCGWSEPDGALVWLLRDNRCDAAAGCVCDPPSPRTCSIPGEGAMTPCYRPDTSSTTTSGSTTTSADQCAQHTCKWLCWNQDGQFYWQRIESCPQECSCNNGYAPPSEDCVCATVGQVRVFACATTQTTTTSDTCQYYWCSYECWGPSNPWTLYADCPLRCKCSQIPTGPCPDPYYARAIFLCGPKTDTQTGQGDCHYNMCYYYCAGDDVWELRVGCPLGCNCPATRPAERCPDGVRISYPL